MKTSEGEATPFCRWLEESAYKGLLHKGGIRLRNIDRIKTEIFVFNTDQGDPLCVFEVSNARPILQEVSLLPKIPPWALKLPAYTVLYTKVEGKGELPIVNFRVKKATPTKRFVGDFNPRDFAGFMAATITFLRKKHHKENG